MWFYVVLGFRLYGLRNSGNDACAAFQGLRVQCELLLLGGSDAQTPKPSENRGGET